jgi:cellobiose-specific phosphotransferase system component IIB
MMPEHQAPAEMMPEHQAPAEMTPEHQAPAEMMLEHPQQEMREQATTQQVQAVMLIQATQQVQEMMQVRLVETQEAATIPPAPAVMLLVPDVKMMQEILPGIHPEMPIPVEM